jgi:hypothetical protein
MLFSKFNIKDALAVAYEEGYEEGYKIGFEEGYKIGCEEGKILIVLKALSMGFSIEVVSKFTGLDLIKVAEINNRPSEPEKKYYKSRTFVSKLTGRIFSKLFPFS